MWLILGLCSALLLGTYDVCKKVSLQDNAVIPVLLVSIMVSSVLLCPLLVVSRLWPESLAGTLLYVPQVDWRAHLFILLKSVIVLGSWICSYFALKHLPITLASPISATRPAWTVLGALLIFGERLNGYQWAGVVIALVSFYLFSVAGRREGISFGHNKWFWFLIAGTLLGAVSGLYDKYLMREFDRMAVQVYYTFYQAAIMAVITWVLWWPVRGRSTPFRFRWSILLISMFLVAADFFYFYALSLPGSLISVLSTVRRLGVVVPFVYGAAVMHDRQVRLKLICLSGVLLGMFFLFLGSYEGL